VNNLLPTAVGPAGLAAVGNSVISATDRRAFREQGYVVIPEVLSAGQIDRGRVLAEDLLDAEPVPWGYSGQLARWPRFGSEGHPLLDFYRDIGLARLASGLVREDLPLLEPDAAQLAVTVPTYRHRPGGPHLDGITPLLPDGTPFTFTLLAGVWLTDQSEPDRGNLYIWPGTHLRAGAFFAEHGADLLTRPDELRPGPYPQVELGQATQATGPAGSVLFTHYLLAHNIGGHFGPPAAEWRRTFYFRISAAGHKQRWRTIVTDPLYEFR
jgi:hypothetical protein